MEQVTEGDSSRLPHKKNKKKKKSFLAKAKRNVKQERYGRGAQIEPETYSYLLASYELLKKGFQDRDDRQTFVDNVLEKTVNEEVNFSRNQLGCRLVEELLPDANEETLDRYVEAFSKQLRTITSDLYASFVLERLLSVCTDRAVQNLQNAGEIEEEPSKKKKKSEISNAAEYSEEHISKCHAFAIKISKYLLNNLEDFVWNPVANRIIRTSLKCMGGVVSAPCEKIKTDVVKIPKLEPNVSEKNEKSNNKKTLPLSYRVVPDEFKDIVKEYTDRLSQWPQFSDMPFETLTSGLLQMLIFSLHNCDKKLTNKIGKKLLNESFVNTDDDQIENDNKDTKDDKDDLSNDNNVKPVNLPRVFDSEPAVRLLEAILPCVRKKTYTQIYALCFINRLAILASLPGLNFTVQRLFDNCDVKEEFEPMFDELEDKFNKILVCGNTGVLVAIAKACLRLQSKQVKFVNALEKALKCADAETSKYFSVLCLKLLPSDRVDVTKFNEPYFVNIHGSVILQSILQFQRPKKLIDSLLALSPKELLVIFCDAKGCHIADSLSEGPFVGAKSKELLIKRLKGTFQEMAISKYGSRALEGLFKMSPIDSKIKMMEELSNKSQILNSSMFGSLIAQKLNVELFKKSFNSWKSALDKENKLKDSFKDILSKKRKNSNV